MNNKSLFKVELKHKIHILFRLCVLIAIIYLDYLFISYIYVEKIDYEEKIPELSVVYEGNDIIIDYNVLQYMYYDILYEFEYMIYFNDELDTKELENKIKRIRTVLNNTDEKIYFLENKIDEPVENIEINDKEEYNTTKFVAIMGAIGIVLVALINSGFSGIIKIYEIRVKNDKNIMNRTFVFESYKGNMKIVLRKLKKKDKERNEDEIMYINGKKYVLIECTELE